MNSRYSEALRLFCKCCVKKMMIVSCKESRILSKTCEFLALSSSKKYQSSLEVHEGLTRRRPKN